MISGMNHSCLFSLFDLNRISSTASRSWGEAVGPERWEFELGAHGNISGRSFVKVVVSGSWDMTLVKNGDRLAVFSTMANGESFLGGSLEP